MLLLVFLSECCTLTHLWWMCVVSVSFSDCLFFFVQNVWSATLYCLWLPCVTFQWLRLGSVLWLSFFQVCLGWVLVLCYCALGLNKNRKDEKPLALLCHLKGSMHATCLGSGGTVCGEGEATSSCWKQHLFSSVSISSLMTLHLLLKIIQISWIKRPVYWWNKQVIHVMGCTLPTSAGYLQCQQHKFRLFSMCFAPRLQSYSLWWFQSDVLFSTVRCAVTFNENQVALFLNRFLSWSKVWLNGEAGFLGFVYIVMSSIL